MAVTVVIVSAVTVVRATGGTSAKGGADNAVDWVATSIVAAEDALRIDGGAAIGVTADEAMGGYTETEVDVCLGSGRCGDETGKGREGCS